MIRGILLDLSGVLYSGDKPIPGAVHAINELAETRIPVRYLTNTTRSPRQSIINRLDKMGFNIRTEDVYTAPMAAQHYLITNNLIPYLLIHPDLEVEFTQIKSSKFNAVLIGDAAEGFRYENMNQAFRILLDGASLFAMGMNRYFKEGDNFSLDAGPFINALEYACNIKATIIGKPSREFYLSAIESMGCAPKEIIMVGDDVEADVIGAVSAGIQGMLVRTGKYRTGDEDIIKNQAECVADIKEAVKKIIAAI